MLCLPPNFYLYSISFHFPVFSKKILNLTCSSRSTTLLHHPQYHLLYHMQILQITQIFCHLRHVKHRVVFSPTWGKISTLPHSCLVRLLDGLAPSGLPVVPTSQPPPGGLACRLSSLPEGDWQNHNTVQSCNIQGTRLGRSPEPPAQPQSQPVALHQKAGSEAEPEIRRGAASHRSGWWGTSKTALSGGFCGSGAGAYPDW